jgi:hypothetical protein
MCTRDHDELKRVPALWLDCPLVGYQEYPADLDIPTQVLRNCPSCNTTMALELCPDCGGDGVYDGDAGLVCETCKSAGAVPGSLACAKERCPGCRCRMTRVNSKCAYHEKYPLKGQGISGDRSSACPGCRREVARFYAWAMRNQREELP